MHQYEYHFLLRDIKETSTKGRVGDDIRSIYVECSQLYRRLSIVLPSRWSAKTVSPTDGPKVDIEFRKPMPSRSKQSTS